MKISSIAIALALVVPALAGADDKTPAPNKDTTRDTDKDATKDATKDTTKDATKNKKLGVDEIKIVSHIHAVNQMEIDLGRFAVKTSTPPVKKYAQMMIDDHTSADKDLVTFAKTHGLAAIPAEKLDTDAERSAMKDTNDSIAKLKKLKGADFDREYLRIMVNGHQEELAKSDALIAASQNDDLDSMLEARKVVLTRHADAAKELQKSSTQASK